MTTPKLKPNVDVKPVENPVVIEKIFSQRTPFDKIEASVTATLSTGAFRMRYADQFMHYINFSHFIVSICWVSL